MEQNLPNINNLKVRRSAAQDLDLGPTIDVSTGSR